MILDKWQEECLKYDGDLLMCTGRRVGKTYVLARKAVDFVMKKHKPVILVSLTEDQAMIILQMALQYARERYSGSIGKGKYKPKLKELTLMISKRPIVIKVRPVGNTGDATRGFEGGALGVDEASRMPRLFWIAAKPILLTQAGVIWMSSTPHGKQGYFWEKFDEAYNKKDPKARFKVIYVTSEEVLKNRTICETWTEEQRVGVQKILEEEKREMTGLEFGQEYMGLFLDDLRQFFEDDLIERVCREKRREPHLDGKHYLGVDIARMGRDESSFEIITEWEENHYHQENIVTTKTFTTETERRIRDIAKIWKVRKVGIDAGAGTLGVSILDHLMETELKHKVLALNNRAIPLDTSDKPQRQRILKEDMYFNLKGMMERGELKLLNDANVILSLKSIQYEYVNTSQGTSKLKIFGKYSHIVEGLIRAAWLAKKEKTLNLWAG